MSNTIANLKKQLVQLKELHASGVIPTDQFDTSRAKLEKQILDAVMEQPTSSTRSGAKWSLWGGIIAFVVLFAGFGYWWKGGWSAGMQQASSSAVTETTAPTAATGPNAPHTTDNAQIAEMVEKLAQRLRKTPGDAEGWAMLARSYTVLGKRPEALQAYAKAMELRKDDPNLLADYADVMAMDSGGKLSNASMKLVERALQIDPRNLKALALAGTYAFDRKDYAKAKRNWEQVVQFGPTDNPMVQQAQLGLAELKSTTSDNASASSLPQQDTKTAGSPSVSGVVSLSPNLTSRVDPNDTVFIFAQAADGPKMPLAVLRKQVKDLPFQFKLDDSMAMAPAMRLSSVEKVVVGARISKSGNATPQPGDFSAKTAPITVGSADVRLEVR
jgi:cytochrome c-type biogenesis protein CcmH